MKTEIRFHEKFAGKSYDVTGMNDGVRRAVETTGFFRAPNAVDYYLQCEFVLSGRKIHNFVHESRLEKPRPNTSK